MTHKKRKWNESLQLKLEKKNKLIIIQVSNYKPSIIECKNQKFRKKVNKKLVNKKARLLKDLFLLYIFHRMWQERELLLFSLSFGDTTWKQKEKKDKREIREEQQGETFIKEYLIKRRSPWSNYESNMGDMYVSLITCSFSWMESENVFSHKTKNK